MAHIEKCKNICLLGRDSVQSCSSSYQSTRCCGPENGNSLCSSMLANIQCCLFWKIIAHAEEHG
jgi:hypothetical protein